jgi:hypothetical protein
LPAKTKKRKARQSFDEEKYYVLQQNQPYITTKNPRKTTSITTNVTPKHRRNNKTQGQVVSNQLE